MSMRESDRLDAALLLHGNTEYNPDKPWDYLWRIAVDTADSQESRWLYREFERKIPMLLEQGMGNFIDGDARISASASGHFATTHNAVNVSDRDRTDTSYGAGVGGGGKKRTGGGNGGKATGKDQQTPPPPVASQPRPSQPHIKTKKGVFLCAGYNSGACAGSHGLACPSDPTKKHLCH